MLDNGASININGACLIDETWYPAYILTKESSSYKIYVIKTTGYNTSYTITLNNITDVIDGVNEIYPNID